MSRAIGAFPDGHLFARAAVLILLSAIAGSAGTAAAPVKQPTPVVAEGTLADSPTIGVVGAHTPTPQMTERYEREMALSLYRQENWAPGYLYYNDGETYQVCCPPWRVAEFGAGQAVTGLTSVLAEDLVMYAVTDANSSRVYATSTAEPRPRLIADGADLGEGLWFRDPMAISPVKDLLIVTVSPGRKEWVTATGAGTKGEAAEANPGTGEVWLLDCVEKKSRAVLLRSVHLLSCDWSPDGRFAACQLDRPDEGREIGMVDARKATYRKLLAGPGYVAWSADSSAVEVYRVGEGDGEVLSFDAADGRLTRTSPVGNWSGFPEGTVWLSSATTGAWVEEDAAGAGLRVASISGAGRRSELDSAPVRLLSWSYGARLLAFIAGDGTLRVACGLADLGGHERLVETTPQAYYPGAPKRGPLLAVTKSPIVIRSPNTCRAAWVMAEKGPVLVYADQEEGGGEGVWALPFERSTPWWGGRSTLDIRKEMVAGDLYGKMCELWVILLQYGEDHEGKFPSHASGPALTEELKPYAGRPDVFWAPYTPGEVRVRILMPGEYFPHTNFGRDASKAGEIPIVEFDGEEGITLRMYADAHVVSVGPDPPGFVSEEPY